MTRFVLQQELYRDLCSSTRKDNNERKRCFGSLKFYKDEFPLLQFYDRKFVKLGRHEISERSENQSFASTHLEKVWTLLTEHRYWNRPVPDLIVSVTGDALDMDKKVKGAKFKFRWGKELRYVVKNSDSWVITGGTDAGVMQQTGELLRAPDHVMDIENDTTIIGIAAWERIIEQSRMEGKESYVENPFKYNLKHEKKGCTHLNKDHSHFLLIDDENGNWGSEVSFRTDLEQFFHENKNIPIICISIGGGPGTLSTIVNSLKKNTPVILVKGSSRVTQLLIYYHQLKNGDEEAGKISEEDLKTKLTESYHVTVNNGFEKFFRNFKTFINYIGSNMIQIYDPAEDSHTPLDKLILRALDLDIKKRQWHGQENEQGWRSTMKLAVDFDDLEIVKRLMSYKESNIKLSDLPLELALRKNRVDVISVFLEQEAKLRHGDESFKDYELAGHHNFNEEGVDVTDIVSLYKCFMGSQANVTDNLSKSTFSKDAVFAKADDIFIWAVALIRCDLAQILWERVEHPLACLLFACRLLKVLRHNIHPLDEIYEQTVMARSTMQELAVNFINLCGEADERNAQLLLVRQLPSFGNQSPLLLARMAHHRAFIVTDSCKQVIERVWRGPCKADMSSIKILFLTLIAPVIPLSLLIFKFINESNFHQINDNDAVLLKAKRTIEKGYTATDYKNYWYQNLIEFYKSPIVTMFWTFLADLGFFLMILIVIILAYGIGTHAMLYPGEGWDGIRAQNLLLRPYFQMFGELFVDDIRGENLSVCKSNASSVAATDCPSEYGRQFVPWLLGIYIRMFTALNMTTPQTIDSDRDKLLNSWNIQLSLWEDDVRDSKVKDLKANKSRKAAVLNFHRSQTLLQTREECEE
ncbi:DgyrCDS11118 [Dimorphilus gyrociliatus]|uniref:DgyrCDS11118 n=1 Tax=Dimorphilus gyrociliatus TaxID=2664684 RepID=A0A7I8W7D2_9ANNE|nr:DgyrCDS11118 [Dimorphilus gyrociliatus]